MLSSPKCMLGSRQRPAVGRPRVQHMHVDARRLRVLVRSLDERQRQKDVLEILQVTRRKGKQDASVKEAVEKLNVLLPGVINLFKMKAADWACILDDVNGVAEKLILLKSAFPTVNVHKVISAQPKLLLKEKKVFVEDIALVQKALASSSNPAAIINTVPELIDPDNLSRSLSYIKQRNPGSNPVDLLEQNPDVLLHVGESTVEPFAEYGESRVVSALTGKL